MKNYPIFDSFAQVRPNMGSVFFQIARRHRPRSADQDKQPLNAIRDMIYEIHNTKMSFQRSPAPIERKLKSNWCWENQSLWVIYAKQTQFKKCKNEHNLLSNNRLRRKTPLRRTQKRTQTNPISIRNTQFMP